MASYLLNQQAKRSGPTSLTPKHLISALECDQGIGHF